MSEKSVAFFQSEQHRQRIPSSIRSSFTNKAGSSATRACVMHKFSDISEIDWKCNWSLEPPFFISATDYLIKKYDEKWIESEILLNFHFWRSLRRFFKTQVLVISTPAWRNGKVQLMTKLSFGLLTLSSFFRRLKEELQKRCRNILLWWDSSRFPLWLWIIKGHDCFMSAVVEKNRADNSQAWGHLGKRVGRGGQWKMQCVICKSIFQINKGAKPKPGTTSSTIFHEYPVRACQLRRPYLIAI